MLQERTAHRPQERPQPNQWTWEHFCREEARESASAFLERVRGFKSRHASARDVHDSTFTNEFSAAFLEESSILMASESETTLPTTNGASSLPAHVRGRVGNGRRETVKKQKSSSSKSWWNGLFKWAGKSKRERHSSGSSTSNSSQAPASNSRMGSTKRKRRGIRVVKETSTVQLLNLNEECEEMTWNPCKLMLVEQQENYQIEIYCPPRNPMPKMSLFCFLIDEVRSTTLLEIPDSNSCFAVKSQNHGEYVFDVKVEELKEEWVQLLQGYTHQSSTSNGHLPGRSITPRSSMPSSHLATLPRAPSSQQSSPIRSHDSGGLNSSPLLISRIRDLPPRQLNQVAAGGASNGETSGRHLSLSDPRKISVIRSSMEPGESEESVMEDMSSFMRNYSVSRSPNRQRKTMSMFIDNHLSPPNPYVQSHLVNARSSPPPPPVHPTAAEPPARFPYGSPQVSPPQQGSPPPLPKRVHRPYSMFIKNVNVNSNMTPSVHQTTFTPTPDTTPTGSRPLHTARCETAPRPATPTSPRLTTPTGAGVLLSIPTSPHPATPTGAGPLPPTPTSSHPATPIGAEPLPSTPTSPHTATPTGTRPLPLTPTAPHPATPTSGTRPLPLTPISPHPATPTSGTRPLPLTPTSPHPATPTSGTRPLPLTPTSPHPTTPTGTVLLAETPTVPSRKPLNHPNTYIQNGVERKLPQRKISQPVLEVPLSPHTWGGFGSTHDLPSSENLETCSQSSSSSALHPISIAALTKPRKVSISFPSSEDVDSGQFLSVQQTGGEGGNGVWMSGRENARKTGSLSPIARDGICCVEEITGRDKPASPCCVVGNGSLSGDTPSEGEGEGEGDSAPQVESEEGEEENIATAAASSSAKRPSLGPRQGFCAGEEQTDHATLSFPFISQRSSPPHPAPGESAIEENQDPEDTTTRPSGSGDVLPSTPPIMKLDSAPSLSREGATSRSSNLTNASVHSTSSLDDRDSATRADSATSNPIFVETTEGQGYNQAAVHTRHPYEFWATNQQDIANLRTLSQYSWFHGMISRSNASQLVTVNGDRGTGEYLVRQSESREGDFVLTFNYHNRAKHLRLTVGANGCNIQHLWFDSVLSMLDYFKTNSIPLESYWLSDDVRLTSFVDRQASDAFRTTTVLNVDQLTRVPPRRSHSLHLNMSRSVASGSSASGSSHPGTPSSLATIERGGSSSASASTFSLPHTESTASGWRQIFRSQRSSSAGNVGRIQRSHSHNAGSIQSTGRGASGDGGHRGNRANAYVWKNY